jgi:AraC-like DNA-binding protein
MRRMAYFEAAPPPRLAEFVERLCFSSDESDAAPPAVRVVPDGASDVLFSVAPSGACTAQVFGLKTQPLWVETPDPRENFLLRLRPGAAARLFGIAARELTDRAIDLGELVGSRAGEWRERIGAARDAAARREVLERAFGEWAARAARRPDADDALLHSAVSALRRSRGSLRVAALAGELGVGERKLERLFLARVGAAPKSFGRVVRFFAAYQSLAAGRDPLDAALAHGYFDQAHLNRDFARFAGAPPRRIFPSEGARRTDSLRA